MENFLMNLVALLIAVVVGIMAIKRYFPEKLEV